MKPFWCQWLSGVIFACCAVLPASATEKITVFAAASLTNALQEVATAYRKNHDVQVVFSFASSSTLARQIVQGAPADLFISADQQWMDHASDKQQLENETRHTLLGNTLVLIAANSGEQDKLELTEKTEWLDLLQGGRLAVGDPDHVPAGLYAKEALQTLGAWARLEPVLARANNVRSAMALVEREEAPLGIVYGSDALASAKVKVIGIFPASSHKPVEYPVAIVKGHQTPQVSAFYAYLRSPVAAAIFERYGFMPHR